MKKAVAILFFMLALYMAYTVHAAVMTGVFIPKSPDYPVMRDDSPVVFWIFTLGMGGVSLVTAYIGVTLLVDKGPERPDE